MFITCATFQRHAAFSQPAVCDHILQSLQSETADSIECTAYCLLPDHGHFLLTGLEDGSDILRAVHAWKQSTGFGHSKTYHQKLWQGNYWDWLLRDSEDMFAVARYIVSDPLRSGLVGDVLQYRWWGSDRWTREELAREVWDARAPAWWRDWR